MTHGSLFSGIGGFEEGAKRAGIKTLWNCEINEYAKKVLQQRYPESTQFGDIREANITQYVDIISGGFPCQDISLAGLGKGISGERSGLWAEMFRVIRRIRPKYVLIENSPALLIRGFERVLCDLSKIGYDAEWQVISNVSFGYPHRRERLYVIAYSNAIRQKWGVQKEGSPTSLFTLRPPNKNCGRILAKRIYALPNSKTLRAINGFQHWTHRVGSIGNAVNPTVAHYLFECINKFEKTKMEIFD